jgi:hypothetical protein
MVCCDVVFTATLILPKVIDIYPQSITAKVAAVGVDVMRTRPGYLVAGLSRE